MMLKLKFRSLLMEDADWITEFLNDPEAAKYWEPYPITEHEVKEWIRKKFEASQEKTIVAEVEGEPAGSVSVDTETGRCRHIGELGIFVRRKFWGKGVGKALMNEAIKLANQLGCRKLVLDTTEGNERAIGLYKKFGFEIEAHQTDLVHFEGSWRKEYFMGLQLAPCEPEINQKSIAQPLTPSVSVQKESNVDINVRQLMESDLDELHRLQNCPESTKSSNRVPPTTKEETKRWYEEIKLREGKYCFGCFENEMLLGYLRFRGGRPPYSNLWFEEILVDVNRRPVKTADALTVAVKGLRERYGYHKIFAQIPQTAVIIKTTLEKHGFKNTGAIRRYYFVDGYYVDMTFYEYP